MKYLFLSWPSMLGPGLSSRSINLSLQMVGSYTALGVYLFLYNERQTIHMSGIYIVSLHHVMPGNDPVCMALIEEGN